MNKTLYDPVAMEIPSANPRTPLYINYSNKSPFFGFSHNNYIHHPSHAPSANLNFINKKMNSAANYAYSWDYVGPLSALRKNIPLPFHEHNDKLPFHEYNKSIDVLKNLIGFKTTFYSIE